MIHLTVWTPQRTQPHPNRSALLASSARLGIRSVVLTHEEIPTRYFQIYKLFLARRFLRHLAPDDLVLFTDATDVCFVNHASEAALREAFAGFGADIVFSAERNCFPEDLAPRVPRLPGPYPFLNTGGYMGRAEALLDLFSSVLGFRRWPIARTCDQNSLWRLLIHRPDAFVLDHEARIFQSAFFPADLTIVADRVGNVFNDRTPLVLHFNGRKDVLDRIPAADSDEPLAQLGAHVRARGWVPDPGLVASLPVLGPADVRGGVPAGPFCCRIPYRPTGTRPLAALIGPFERAPSLDEDLADLTFLFAGKGLDPVRFALKRVLGR